MALNVDPCPQKKSATSHALISPIHSTPRSNSRTKCHQKKLFSFVLKFSREYVSLTSKLWTFEHITSLQKRFNIRPQCVYCSSHPLSVEKGFIKGETLRLLRTNPVNEIFELRKLEFVTRLLERGYPRELTENISAEVKFSSRNEALQNKTKRSRNVLSFITNFSPATPKT